MENYFIRFRRTNDFGNLTNRWGFHIRNISFNKMEWYIPGVGIESGVGIVTIIEFESVLLPVVPDIDREY